MASTMGDDSVTKTPVGRGEEETRGTAPGIGVASISGAYTKTGVGRPLGSHALLGGHKDTYIDDHHEFRYGPGQHPSTL